MFGILVMVTGGLWIAAIFMVIICTTWYDIAETHRQSIRAKHPHARRYRYRPAVTLMIQAGDDVTTTVAAIQAACASTYKKCQIVVTGRAQYEIPLSTKRTIWFYPGSDTQEAFVVLGSGEIVVMINDHIQIEPGLVTSIVRRFVEQSNLMTLDASMQPTTPPSSLLELFTRYHVFLEILARKTREVIGITPVHTSITAIKADEFIAPRKQHFAKRLAANLYRIFRRINLVLLPIALTYAIYLAASLHEPDMLVLTIGLFSICMVAAIWLNSRLKLVQKLSYSLLLPITFAYFYGRSFVRAVQP